MIIHTMEQGTPEWFAVRSGVPTASRFKDVFTSTGKASASQDKYINELIAEKISLKPLESFTSEWMTRGTELEPEARTYYQLETGNAVTEVGFATVELGSGVIGGSPDGLTDSGGLEIKCPSPAKHVEYLRKRKCPAEYFPQVQGLMLIFDKPQWDFMSYHPDLEKQLIITVERDEQWQADFILEIEKFNQKLTKAISQMEAA